MWLEITSPWLGTTTWCYKTCSRACWASTWLGRVSLMPIVWLLNPEHISLTLTSQRKLPWTGGRRWPQLSSRRAWRSGGSATAWAVGRGEILTWTLIIIIWLKINGFIFIFSINEVKMGFGYQSFHPKIYATPLKAKKWKFLIIGFIVFDTPFQRSNLWINPSMWGWDIVRDMCQIASPNQTVLEDISASCTRIKSRIASLERCCKAGSFEYNKAYV